MVEVQDQKAYQKQRGITGVHSGSTSKKTPGKNGARWYKSVGLGFKTPKEAIEGNYIDKKCPFTGNVSIRGRILTGVVKSTKVRRVRGGPFHPRRRKTLGRCAVRRRGTAGLSVGTTPAGFARSPMGDPCAAWEPATAWNPQGILFGRGRVC
jgi:hypothetical protein